MHVIIYINRKMKFFLQNPLQFNMLPAPDSRNVQRSAFCLSNRSANPDTDPDDPGPHRGKFFQQMLKLHQFGIMSAPTTSQYAAIEAMRNGDKDIEHMREEYDSRRRYLVENLNRIGLTCFEPKGAFYVFPCIKSSGLTSEEFCERFLMEEKVAVIPGTAFGPGGEGFVRACYAASMKDIAEALTRMDNFLTNLRKKQAREG